jgi:hypothetical protein
VLSPPPSAVRGRATGQASAGPTRRSCPALRLEREAAKAFAAR